MGGFALRKQAPAGAPVVGFPPPSLQGSGYLTAVADELPGMATLTVLEDDEMFVTADIRMNYFRPVRGGELVVEAFVLRKGRSGAHIEATFSTPDGKLVAKASATQNIRRET